MGFIFDILGFLVFVLCIPLFLGFLKSAKKDVQEAEEDEFEGHVEQLKNTPGERLFCSGCDHWFDGPLDPSIGCPKCHMSGLVLTQPEYDRLIKKEQIHA